MPVTRRNLLLTGLAGLGTAATLPAWAQAIGSQSDPWAQVDPYDDPRNGFPSQRAGGAAAQPQRPAGASPFAPGAGEQDEIAIGRAAYPRRIQKGGGACPDPRIQQALRDFCRPLFAVSNRPALPWTVTMVNARDPNASAGLGGMVIVHGGLVALFDNPYHLASVMAHEIGHVDLGHMARGNDIGALAEVARAQGATALGDQAMEQLLPETRGRVADFMTLMDMTFSREDEAEADAHVIEVFSRAGIDPRLASGAMRTILEFERRHGVGAPSEWLTDHPLTPDRIQAMDALAATRSRPASNVVLPGWDVLKSAYPTIR